MWTSFETLQKWCTSLWELFQRKTLFDVDVSVNWATNRNWQAKVLDRRKGAQLNLLRQESVKQVQLRSVASVGLACKDHSLFVGCLTSQQHASVSQGRICTDNFTCCHTEIEVADPTFHLTQSQYTDTGPTNPSADPITPGAWQGSHWSANV